MHSDQLISSPIMEWGKHFAYVGIWIGKTKPTFITIESNYRVRGATIMQARASKSYHQKSETTMYHAWYHRHWSYVPSWRLFSLRNCFSFFSHLPRRRPAATVTHVIWVTPQYDLYVTSWWLLVILEDLFQPHLFLSACSLFVVI